MVMYLFAMGWAVDGLLADGASAVAVAVGLAHIYKRGWEDRFRGGGEPDGREAGLVGLAEEQCEGGVDNAGPDEASPSIVSRLWQTRVALVRLACVSCRLSVRETTVESME